MDTDPPIPESRVAMDPAFGLRQNPPSDSSHPLYSTNKAAFATATGANAASVPAGFLCYKCSYHLAGLAANGACPECSTPYALALAFRGKPHPGQLPLVVRIIWPVAVGGSCAAAALILKQGRISGRDIAAMLVAIATLAAIYNVINILVASSSLCARYVPPHRRTNWMRNMFFLGPWVGTAWLIAMAAALLCTVGPVLGIASCIFMGR